nr:hypothetical protein [uncultured Mediterraneibacter sp.]
MDNIWKIICFIVLAIVLTFCLNGDATSVILIAGIGFLYFGQEWAVKKIREERQIEDII